MKKNMVIHCATGICNSGDEAILSVLLNRYKTEFDITVISLNCEYTRLYHSDIFCIENNNTSKCKEAIKKCDVFILGGGGLLQDQTTIFNIFRWLKYLQYAIKQKKKTMLYANSIGPLKYIISKRYVKKYLNKVTLITLRDKTSERLLRSIGVHVHIEVTADPVFSMNTFKQLDKQRILNDDLNIKLPPRYICISVRHWFDTIPFIPVSLCSKFNLRSKKNTTAYKNYINTLAQITSYCIKTKNIPIVFVSFLPQRDTKVIKDIIKKTNIPDKCIIISEHLSPQIMANIIGRSDFLIGMRLHSIIYAIIYNIPFIALNYSMKVKAILQYMHLNDYILDLNTLDLESFTEMFSTYHIEDVKQKMTVIFQEMQRKERKNDILLQKLVKEAINNGKREKEQA